MSRPPFAAVTVAGALALASCSIVPEWPSATPDTWLPEPSVSPTAPGFESDNGFTPGEFNAYRIRNFGCEASATGSGFAIDANTIVTNKHVIEGYSELTANGSDGTDITITAAFVATNGDLAFLTTAEPLPFPQPLASVDVELGEQIVIVGYPLGDEMTSSEGAVLRETDDTLDVAEFVFETNASTRQGSSGSAVYDEDWNVVGVLYAGDEEDGSGNSYFVPVSVLNEFLDDEEFQRAQGVSC